MTGALRPLLRRYTAGVISRRYPLRWMASLLVICSALVLQARAQTAATAEQARQAGLAQREADLRAAIARGPASADQVYSLADTLFLEHKAADSLASFTQAAALRPPSAKDLQTVALDYVLLDDYVDAEHWMSRSVQGQPDSSEAWYDLGRIRYSRSRTENAAEAFERALRLDPHSLKAENNLGLALEAEGRTADAEAAYRLAIGWQKDDAHPSEQPLLNLGILLINLDRTDEALPLLEQAYRLAPGDPRISEQLGRAYLQQGKLGEAQSALERGISLAPDIASIHYLLGKVLAKESRKDAANAEFARMAELTRQQAERQATKPQP